MVALASGPVVWPVAPPADAWVEGRNLARLGKPLDAAAEPERRVVGRWFDGTRLRAVDEVVRVGPALAGRKSGWASERGDGEAEWQSWRARHGDGERFVVILYALPKQPVFVEGDPFRTGDPLRAQAARFRLVGPTGDVPLEVESAFHRQREDWRDLVRLDWRTVLRREELPERLQPGGPWEVRLGGFYQSAYVLRALAPLPDRFELRIETIGPVRVAAFP